MSAISSHLPIRTRLALWLASWLVACAANVDDAEPAPDAVRSLTQAVTGGARVDTAQIPDTGVVRVRANGTCTGTLITNRWVLTADHCFCPEHEGTPSLVTISTFGKPEEDANNSLRQIYSTVATKVIRHPDLDVALVKLQETLPYAWPVALYTGSGDNSLVGQTARVIGYGHNRFNAQGVPEGYGESLNFGDMRITSISPTSQGGSLHQCGSTNFWTRNRPGPRLASLPGDDVMIQEGDSGGGLFLGNSEQTKLLGVASGGEPDGVAYVGIWHVRDWIKQKTDIWTASECLTTLPSSLNADKPALATGPDGKLHAVAVFPDASVGHWISDNGKSWTFKDKIPGVATDSSPALTTELAAAPNQGKRLGLAYRNKSDSVLRYARWSAAGGWAAPLAIPSGLKLTGGLSGHGGIIALIGTDNRVGVTGFDAPSKTFIAAQWAPPSAPKADPGKSVSVVHDPISQIALIGWRTADSTNTALSNQWVQAYGSWNCLFGSSQSYICNNDPPYATDWQQASLGYVRGDQIYLETVRALPNGWHRHERRTVQGAASFDWGWAHYVLGTQTISDYQGEIYALRSMVSGSLTIGPVGNCYGSQF
jgi:hypothetical protein